MPAITKMLVLGYRLHLFLPAAGRLAHCSSSSTEAANQQKQRQQHEEWITGAPLVNSPFANPNRVVASGRPLMAAVVAETGGLLQQQKSPASADQPSLDLDGFGVSAEVSRHGQAQQEDPTTGRGHEGRQQNLGTPDGQAETDEQNAGKEGPNSGSSSGDQTNSMGERQWKSVKWGIVVFGGLAVVGAVFVIFEYAPTPKDPVTGEKLQDKYSDFGQPMAGIYRIMDLFAFWRKFIVDPTSEKLLPDPLKPPYHQPKYTVVLELRNVLINPQWEYKKGHYFVKRPALDYFLDVVGYPNFELVVYTSETMPTGTQVLQQVDKAGQHVNHALFRDSCKYVNSFLGFGGDYVKDLSRLNRDPSKVIFIDWEPAAAKLAPENFLMVPKWEGQMDDTGLVDLAELLKTIHLSDVDDVRSVLQFYNQFDNPMAEFRRRAMTLEEKQTTDAQSSATTASSDPSTYQQLKKYRGSLFGARRHAV